MHEALETPSFCRHFTLKTWVHRTEQQCALVLATECQYETLGACIRTLLLQMMPLMLLASNAHAAASCPNAHRVLP